MLHRGDIVSYQNYVLSRMPEVWGDDAHEFKPSRWFKDNGESISYSPFSTYFTAIPAGCHMLSSICRISLLERRTA